MNEQDFFLRFRVFKNESPEFFDFCEMIYKNRFFVDESHPVMRALVEAKDSLVDTLYQGTTVYRARIVSPGLQYEPQDNFFILNEKEIGAPPVCNEGRANPPYTSTLYVSDTPYCALSEVRPACNEVVAIGTGVIQSDLRYLSFIRWPSLTVNRKKTILDILEQVFSNPVLNNREYLPTQVITEFIRNKLQLDGIAYSSSQCTGGIDYSLFNPQVVKFQTARPVHIRGIQYLAESYLNGYSSLTVQKRNFSS